MTESRGTGATQSLTASTVSFGAHQPSRVAQATRSLTAAERLRGVARREALTRHFETFVSPGATR